MIRRIATLLGLFGLAALVCLAAAFTSGCGTPLTKGGFQQNLAHGLGPVHGRLDAQHQMTKELQGEVQQLWISLREVANGQQTIAEWAATTTDRLVQLERAGKITQRDLGLARSAIENLKKQMAVAHVETRKVLGEKIDTATATTGTAIADVGQKVDERADEVVEAVQGVDRKVDMTKTAAEKAVVEAESAKSEAIIAGSKADAAGAKAEAASAKAGADTVVEVSEARKELADHAAEAVKTRAGIIAELNRLITRPLP